VIWQFHLITLFLGIKIIESPLRILHLIYTSGIYGAEKHLLNLLPELKKYGVQCHLLFICPKKSVSSLQSYCRQLNERGVKSALVPTTSKISVLLTAKKIFRYLKSNKIGVIHTHLFSADLIAVLIKIFYLKNLIILSTKHGYEEKYLLQYGLGDKKIKYNLYYFISRSVIRRIDYNLAVSDSLAKIYVDLKLVKNKMPVISHGISLQDFSEEPVLLNGSPKIIMVGRLSEIKGHTYLFQALPKIIEKFPELKLFILGEGPLKDQLMQQATNLKISDHIEWVGFANPQIFTPQCELIVVPSLYESFGLVYIESFVSKIAVVAFKTETAGRIIENNETGILVEKENIRELGEKIIYLLENPEERERITKNAFEKFQKFFNTERMAKETAEWYHSVLKDTKE
jgi:glycosyltransferase involved in cell wall biosynthesis